MSKQIDISSAPASKSELDLFSVPPTQVAVQAGYWCGYRLNNPITNSGPYRFVVPRENYMLDLSKNYVYMRFRIVNHDNTAITNQTVGVINLFGKTFFERCIVKLGDKEIYNSGGLYAYQSYIETLLNFGHEAKDSHLQSGFFYKDTAEQFDSMADNEGFKTRSAFTINSRYVELMAPLHCELFVQDKYLLNQCNMTIELHRNSDAFCLMWDDDTQNFKLDIKDMRFYVYKVKVQDSLAMSIDRILLEKRIPARYPIRRARLVNRLIAPGTRSLEESYVFQGQLPRRLVFGMVNSKSFNGDHHLNPFNFTHFNLTEASIWIGDRQVPSEPLKMNFTTNEYMLPYVNMVDGCGFGGSEKGNWITYQDYKSGNALFVFELTPDNLDTACMQLVEEGTVRVQLTFSRAIQGTDGVELIVYGEFDNIITIDYNRTVFTDF